MTSTARFERLAALHLAAAFLLLVAAPAQAETVRGKLQVSAQVVISCRLDANVPRVGTAERRSGGASFSVQCTRGATAAVARCEDACGPVRDEGMARNEKTVAEPRDDGTTVATVLF